ncbi:fumarylacetoacetate hydrolase family protein [Bacillaceae bacterium SIJ1]|uniref:fumarylacetoacetate hydrolase family protein n=1 Tax=Litoribacterium kuwaitense TaxID=1398745 RepID=UPI0013EAF037|nr:fumarylacetoacetate hydrolase family protein [Litoribacterium kuwaitense]NGP44521.1 fumarylacetoacetate hydrolase family protein [Litoribacterium kuwaitense]
MKWMQGVINGVSFVGVELEDGRLLDVGRATYALSPESQLPSSLLECLEHYDVEGIVSKLLSFDFETLRYYAYDPGEVALQPPLTNPYKHVLCIGKNYADHVTEMTKDASLPEAPVVFTKGPGTIIGHQSPIPAHSSVTAALDYEGELAVVIGKKGRAINQEDAFTHVFGYTILNDVTARDLQTKHKQFYLGKSLDGTCPIGPYVISKDAIPDVTKLTIETRVNGELRQRGSLKDLIFDIPTIIAELSKGMTLVPGDIIATGTPAGVGKGMNPPMFLRQGDTVAITIAGIGELVNTVK